MGLEERYTIFLNGSDLIRVQITLLITTQGGSSSPKPLNLYDLTLRKFQATLNPKRIQLSSGHMGVCKNTGHLVRIQPPKINGSCRAQTPNPKP